MTKKKTTTAAEADLDAEAAGETAADTSAEAMQRAEEVVDQLGEKVGEMATRWSKDLQRFAARAREEAEDILAEAQALRGRK